MGTITDKLNKVLETKSNLKTAIINKGGSIDSSTPFSQYATVLESLPKGITGVTYTDNTLAINKNDELINVDINNGVNNININYNYEGFLFINTDADHDIAVNSGASAYIENQGRLEVFNYGGTVTATNLSAENIKSGVNILGKTGTYETPTETKTVTPTRSTQTITPSTGKHLSKVTVYAISSSYIIPSGTKSITSNGTYDITNYVSVNVNVESSGGSDVVFKKIFNDYY